MASVPFPGDDADAKALGRAPGTVTAVTLHGWRVTGAAQTRADLVASIVNKQFPTAGSRAALLREARELAHPRAGALVTILSWVPEGARSNTERRLAQALAKLSSSLGSLITRSTWGRPSTGVMNGVTSRPPSPTIKDRRTTGRPKSALATDFPTGGRMPDKSSSFSRSWFFLTGY